MNTAFSQTANRSSLESAKLLTAIESTDLASYMHLVHQVVARFMGKLPPNVLRDDLVAAGTYGLVDSLRKNGEERGPTFEWYARVRIRGAILDELRTQDWLSRRARRAVTESATAEGARSSSAAFVGFDDLPVQSAAFNMIDESAQNPFDMVEEGNEREDIADAVQDLPERERCIVVMHYFQGAQFKTIAETLGVSEPRVSQLHMRAVGLLRSRLEKTMGEYAA